MQPTITATTVIETGPDLIRFAGHDQDGNPLKFTCGATEGAAIVEAITAEGSALVTIGQVI